jgi:drug/metabolite transporter (DMT)-like permease
MNARLLLLLSVVFASCGQVLFKKGMALLGTQNISANMSNMFRTLISIVFSPWVFTGLVLYGLSTLLWLFALSKTTLNYAYPFTILTFILVMAASYFIFSETIPLNRMIGAGVICIGILIASFK